MQYLFLNMPIFYLLQYLFLNKYILPFAILISKYAYIYPADIRLLIGHELEKKISK